MSKTITGLHAGSTTVTATYKGGTVSNTFTVNKAAGSVGSVSGSPITVQYSASARTIQLEMTGNTGTLHYTFSSCKKGSTTQTGWSCTDAGVLTIPANAAVYTTGYTVTCTLKCDASDDYNAVTSAQTKTWTVKITKADISPTVTMSNYVYGGTKSSPGITSGTNPGNGTVTYYYNTTNSNSGGTAWSTVTNSSSLNVGTYYMYATVGATTNYNGATTPIKSFQITQREVTVTAPTFTSGTLTYNGNSQYLTTTGSISPDGVGTMYYYIVKASSQPADPTFSTSTWTTSRPAKTEAGKYYVWYYAKVDDTTNNTGSDINTVLQPSHSTDNSKTISQATNPITLTPTTATIYSRDGYNTVQLSVTNAQGTVSYTTSASGKATVNTSGLVTYVSSGSATITATAAGNTNYLSGSKTCAVTTVVDTENSTKYKNEGCTTSGYNIVYVSPTVTLATGITAGGGKSTVTCAVTNNTNWYQKWVSGYVSYHTGTETGTARWNITSNGSSRFTPTGTSSSLGTLKVYNTGGSVSHSTMGSWVGTDSVTVTAYNVGDSTKTATSSRSVSNALESIALTVGASSIVFGNTTSATVKASYTSGMSTHDVTTAVVSWTTNPSGIIEIS